MPGSPRTTPKIAQAAIDSHVTPLPTELRPLAQCAGRVLRQDIYPERDNPPFDRVCMDGIAVDSAAAMRGARQFTVEATQQAGARALTLSNPDHAIEIMTGAVLPPGADCIVPMEEYTLSGNVASLNEGVTVKPYRNVQRRGVDSQPGIPMLKAGTLLGAPEMAVVASAGLAHIRVSRQPRVMVVSTGDELVEPGHPIEEHQVRRSNAYAIVGALHKRGFDQVDNDHIPDNDELLRERLGQHLSRHDVLILSGGVSHGKFDLVPEVLQSLAVKEILYEVAQRPGMPLWFGIGPAGQTVFGLPGNPVATLVCLIRYAVPAMSAATGAPREPPQTVTLGRPVKFNKGVTYFLPVSVHYDERGCGVALPRPPNGPGDFLSLAGSHGFVELPPQAEDFPEGFRADFYRW